MSESRPRHEDYGFSGVPGSGADAEFGNTTEHVQREHEAAAALMAITFIVEHPTSDKAKNLKYMTGLHETLKVFVKREQEEARNPMSSQTRRDYMNGLLSKFEQIYVPMLAIQQGQVSPSEQAQRAVRGSVEKFKSRVKKLWKPGGGTPVK